MKDREYSLNGYLGLVHQRKNPDTGTTVSVYHSEQAGMDASWGTKYHAVCEDHGALMGETSIARAKSAAMDSGAWCPDCVNIVKNKEKSRIDHFTDGVKGHEN